MVLPITDLDRRIWEEELEGFLPQRIFDAHVHFFHNDHCLSRPGQEPPEPETMTDCPVDRIDREVLLEMYQDLLPGREVHFQAFGWVYRRLDFDQHNAFTAAQVSEDPNSTALMLVHPSFSAEKVAQDLDRYGFRGLKPYIFWAYDPIQCDILDMLPEPIIELANERELVVVLHLGKRLGIADENNMRNIISLCKKYPKVRWNLAHMGRSSISWPLERAIDRIRDLPNVWYDFSSVTNTDVFTLAFRKLPLDRIMFGSDIPSDLQRGTMVGFGYGWALITDKTLASLDIQYCDPRTTYVLYETIRAARRACILEGFGEAEIRDLFYNNAARFIEKDS